VSRLPVRPELGPALPELAGRRWWLYVAVPAVFVLVAVLVGGGTVGSSERELVVREGGPAFNLRYDDRLRRVAPAAGERLRLEGRRGEVFAVAPLRLPPHAGRASGTLPLLADRLVRQELPRAYPGFALAGEGRARVNEAPGYEVVFRWGRPGDRQYGRVILLVPDTEVGAPPVREGARLVVLAPRSGAVPNAAAVGTAGALRLPFRSFRFGTEAP